MFDTWLRIHINILYPALFIVKVYWLFIYCNQRQLNVATCWWLNMNKSVGGKRFKVCLYLKTYVYVCILMYVIIVDELAKQIPNN